MTATEPSLSIGEVSARTGLTTYTLRFYEQEGLFIGPVQRDSAGRRVFTEAEVEWLDVCTRLRSSGMPLADIHRYAELARAGAGTVGERLEVLRAHEATVRAQMVELQAALDVIAHKVGIYERHLAAGTADELWRHGPECAAE